MGNKRKNKANAKGKAQASTPVPPPELKKAQEKCEQPLDSDDEREQAFMLLVKEARERVKANLESDGLLGKSSAATDQEDVTPSSSKTKKPTPIPTNTTKLPYSVTKDDKSTSSLTNPYEDDLFSTTKFEHVATGASSVKTASSATLPLELYNPAANFSSGVEDSSLSSFIGSPISSPVSASFLQQTPTQLFSPRSGQDAAYYMASRFSSDYPQVPPVQLLKERGEPISLRDIAAKKARKTCDAPFKGFEIESNSLKNVFSVRAHDFVLNNLQQLWAKACYSTSPVYGRDSPIEIANYFLSELPSDVTHGSFLPSKKSEFRNALTWNLKEVESLCADGEVPKTPTTPGNTNFFERLASENASVVSFTQANASIIGFSEIPSSSDATLAAITPLQNNVEEWRKKSLNDLVTENREEIVAAESSAPRREPREIHDLAPYRKWIVIWATAFVQRMEREAHSRRVEALDPIAKERAQDLRGHMHPAAMNAEAEKQKSEHQGMSKAEFDALVARDSDDDELTCLVEEHQGDELDRIAANLKKAGF